MTVRLPPVCCLGALCAVALVLATPRLAGAQTAEHAPAHAAVAPSAAAQPGASTAPLRAAASGGAAPRRGHRWVKILIVGVVAAVAILVFRALTTPPSYSRGNPPG